jgi:SpoVK/Ycf46/Vps4 family AAA+-type ATPase
MVSDHAARNSIYLGQVVDVNFDFMKLTDFKPENVAITDTLRSKIELFVTGPLRYSNALDERGLPRKSGLFLYGPPGGGKTMAKTVCQYMAARMGAIVVEVDPSLGVEGFAAAAARTDVLLENGHKVVIGMEDMEKLATKDRAKVLDILDGTSSKGFRRITIGTTNFLETIDRAMLRPGRFDAVEFCGLPDLSAFTQLVKVLIREEDRGDIDYAEAYPYFEGYSYAFISNAVQIILRAAINRAKGDLSNLSVNTQDLIDAANAVRGHFDLMQEEVVKERPVLDQVFTDLVYGQVEEYLENNAVDSHDYTSYESIKDIVHEQVDEVVEARLHQASIVDRDGERKFNINTN